MNNPNYEFCDELDAPEMCVILNQDWWKNNKEKINEWHPSVGMGNGVLYIPESADRTYFMLRWPQ